MDTESKKVLDDLFSILELPEDKREASLLMFRKKISEEVLNRVKGELPQEYQDFIEKEGRNITDPHHPMVTLIRGMLKNLHTDKEYEVMAHESLKSILPEYVAKASQMNIGAEKAAKLDERIKEFS